MEEILARLLVADNAVIQKASRDLKEAFKKNDSVLQLCSVIVESSNPQIRQYAAVLLRQRFSKCKHWEKLGASIRTNIKEGILRALVFEPEKFVKKAIAQLIGTLIRYEIPRNTWPQLLDFIFKTCSSAEESEQILGVFTLSILTEISPNQFTSHTQGVASLLVGVLKDSTDDASSVVLYCVDTMKNLVPIADDDNHLNNMYHLLMPRVLRALKVFSQTDEMKACELLDMFDDLIDSTIINQVDDVKLLIDLGITLSRNQALREMLRVKALSVIESCIKSKKKAIIKHNLLLPILETVFLIMKTPSPDDSEIDESDSPVSIASQVLDSLALYLPPDKLMPTLLQHIQVGLEGEDPYGQKASYMAMAVIAEGCAEYIRLRYLERFMDLVCKGLVHSHNVVRDSALYALGQFSEYLQPDISKHSERLMPILFNFLEQLARGLSEGCPEPASIDRVFYALEAFIENSDKKTFLPYLNLLMERLLSLFVLKSSTHFKELVLSTLGGCATAAEDDIYPFFPKIVECISAYLKDNIPQELLPLQTQAIDTLSTLARAISPEHFRPISSESIHLGLKLLDEQTDPDLRRSAYCLFGAISLVLKQDMGRILEPVVKHMLSSIESSDGVVLHYKDTGLSLCDDLSDTPDEEDIEQTDDEDDDDDDDDDDVAGYTVENSYLDEKTAACSALKEMAVNVGQPFNLYLEPCFEGIFKLLVCPQEDVRKVAVETLTQLVLNFAASSSDDRDFALKRALCALIPKCSELIRTDPEREVAMQALESYSSMVKTLKGRMFVSDGHKEAVMNSIKAVFGKRTACQDTDEESSLEEGAEQEELLIECAGDIVPYFGKAITPDEFVPYFISIMPYLTARFKKQCTVAQRSFGVGILAECMEPLGPRIHQFIHQILPAFVTLAQDDHHDIRNNAIFGLGEFVYHGKEHVFVHYTDILNLLSQCVSTEQDPSVLDNICGALARMMLVNASLIPLNEVFPYFIRLLPLRTDYKENTMVFKCLLHFYEGGQDLLLLHLEDLLMKTVSVIHHKQGEEDALQLAERFFFYSLRDFPDKVGNIGATLSPELITTYEELLVK